ncbi:rab11 family-interacting protein 3 isoform X6 [Phlebotomus papatasi]|uniref:rab11 family-interacting protein 3 isoform X6 n=1 Tax=Phlebotomus papatasi TaxID=29031 RepID=UPI00248429FA|nr:rab11 family-interacting protein 3 isoform X6 [Phlebotomus papatasi]XP_055705011.1 rab11 family-interacting protein 3 isoform X6 [Phlebotomus papatasi]XP_055705012.1 rab11 family-interacting protein 3 isoform X6 [Phlebotomus papatasi]XP_055705013.1 rab11 family-interacting protein 3 isoform X6 [Phlebotomus papatasi]XP_055705014.1 rab11 family-interacting protein 3 isoform X6 [Phlebotomus papatasi]XP_055705015.1 rab11 family-interacting protein 3 isoform X6 [Phlebotomus papatasi]
MTTPESRSQPESLDLDYDLWQGQFEFIGPINGINGRSSSLEDLDLSCQNHNYDKNKPILVDEETFLSLHATESPSDSDEDDRMRQSGPHSGFFIDDCGRGTPDTLKDEDFNILKREGTKDISPSQEQEKLINDLVEINNAKNNLKSSNLRLIADNQKFLRNGTTKMNGIKAEVCDNLNEQLELLQRQVTNLADSQNNVEDITTRTKTEYAVLQARYHMLEEQLRECEMRAEERIAEEQRRNRELLARMEREAQLQSENCQMKVRTVEKEAATHREEVQRLRLQCDKQAADLHATEEKLEITNDNYTALQQDLLEVQAREKKLLAEKVATEELMLEMSREVDRLRSERGPAMPTTSPESIRLEELHQELDELRQINKNLEEANEELQALVLTRGVEEGRNLLNGTSNSLAQELHDMSQSQLQSAYQDKEEENVRLKHYIDTILLNIVENYPQLLEVKTNSVSNTKKD